MTSARHDDQPDHPRPAATAPAARGPAAPKKRRWLWRLALSLLLVVVAVVATVSFAPGPIARLLLHYYVDDLGIDVDGEQTLEVNLWKGIIRFGPANFRLGAADPGQVANLGLDFSVRSLFGKRALVTTLIIEGLNLKLTRSADGELSLNGVPLSGLTAPKTEDEIAAEKRKGGWGAGIDSFDLRNSRLVFVTPQDRQAALAISHLNLTGFRTWQPDEPGTFSLAGELNGMPVSADGEAYPFADQLQVGLKYQVSEIELAKIEQFTGPLGFVRNAGRMQIAGAGEISQLLKGGTNIASSGSVTIDAMDIAIADAVAIAMPQAASTFQLRTRIEPNGALQSAGSVGLDANSGRVQLADGGVISFDRANLPATDIALAIAADGGLTLRTAPSLDVDKLAMRGPVDLASNSAKLQLSSLDLTTAGADTSLTAAGQLNASDFALATAASKDATGFAMRSPGIEARIAGLELKSDKDATRIIGKATLNTATAEMTLPAEGNEPPLVATFSKLALDTPDVALTVAGDTTQLRGSLTTTVARLAAADKRQAVKRRPRGRSAAATAPTRLAAGPLEIDVGDLALTQQPNKLTLAAALTSHWRGVEAALPIPARPSLALDQLDLTSPSLALAITGNRLQLTGGALVALSDMDARWQSHLPTTQGTSAESRGTLAKLSVNISALDLRTGGSGVTAKAAMGMNGSGIKVHAPALETMAGSDIAVGGLQAQVKELKLGEPSAGSWRAAFDALISDLRTGQPTTVPRMRAEAVDIRNLVLNDRGAVDADAFILTKTDAAISRRWLERLAGDPATAEVAKAAEQVVERATREKAPLRIGHLRVENGAFVNFEDDVLSPPARFALKIEDFDMGELNSERPAGKTDIFLRARLNEFTRIETQGWASPLDAKPDFALNASVKHLQLPQLSPYTAQAIGLNIDSGRLQVNADATARRGELNGVLNLIANSLALAPVSGDAANQAEHRIGVPINTALSLLEDNDGQINLSIPLSGNLASPSFDFSDVIGQAMINVVKGAVLAPFKLALLPVKILADAVSGSPPSLAPIEFDANTVTPTAQGRSVLAALVKLLEDQPKLSVQVCGRSTLQDRQAALKKQALPPADAPIYPVAVADLRAGLGQLAQTRTTVIRQALNDGFGIRRGRVLECRSLFDDHDNGTPRVEIKF